MTQPAAVGRACVLRKLSRVLADDGAPAALITGGTGIGKTRVLEEVAALGRARGWAIEQVTASPSTLSLALAPFAHLEPAGLPPAQDPGERLARMVAAIRANAGDEMLLVVIDDAHHLDAASDVLVHQLVVRGQARVVMTVSEGQMVPEALMALIKEGDAIAVALEPIDRNASDALIELVLGDGAVGRAVLDAIWSLALGNPLFTRELAAFGRETGSLREGAEGWRLVDHLRSSPVLDELVNRRIADLSLEAADVLAALAVAEPLPLRVIEHLSELGLLAALEQVSFISVRDEGDEPLVRLGHPLYGEVLRSTSPLARLHQVRRRVADTLVEHDPGRPTAILTAATLRLESGPRDHELFRRGAEIALVQSEPEQALRLSSAARELDDGPEGRLLHARVLSASGQASAVATELSALASLDLGPEWLAKVTMFHAEHLAFELGNTDDAIALLEARIQALPEEASPLRGLLSHLLFIASRLDDAVTVALPLIETDPPPIESLAGAAKAWAVSGRPAEVLDLWDRAVAGLETTPGRDGETAIAIANFAFMRLLALWQTGRAHEGDDPFAPIHNARLQADLEAPEHRLGIDAVQQFVRGHLDRASAMYHELADRIWDTSTNHAELAGPVRATVEAQRGDREAARRSLAELDRSRLPEQPSSTHSAERDLRKSRSRPPAQPSAATAWWVGRARAWTAAADGDLNRGISTSLDLVDGREVEHFHETTSLHDIVRLGRPDLVADRLTEQAARPGATWWDHACADHAQAARDSDADGLLDVAHRFEAGGLDLHAAEVFAHTLELLDPATDRARFVVTNVRFADLLDRCGQARTPALVNGPVSLTRRELQVARLAARGLTTPEVATRLGTSARTVSNQLQRVYDKLDIHDRAALRELFDNANGAD